MCGGGTYCKRLGRRLSSTPCRLLLCFILAAVDNKSQGKSSLARTLGSAVTVSEAAMRRKGENQRRLDVVQSWGRFELHFPDGGGPISAPNQTELRRSILDERPFPQVLPPPSDQVDQGSCLIIISDCGEAPTRAHTPTWAWVHPAIVARSMGSHWQTGSSAMRHCACLEYLSMYYYGSIDRRDKPLGDPRGRAGGKNTLWVALNQHVSRVKVAP